MGKYHLTQISSPWCWNNYFPTTRVDEFGVSMSGFIFQHHGELIWVILGGFNEFQWQSPRDFLGFLAVSGKVLYR